MPDGVRTRLVGLLSRFVRSDNAGGFVLIAFGLLAFLWANSPLSPAYFSVREAQIGAAGIGRNLWCSG
jgi:Na+:H+ antiporter, NhaA family